MGKGKHGCYICKCNWFPGFVGHLGQDMACIIQCGDGSRIHASTKLLIEASTVLRNMLEPSLHEEEAVLSLPGLDGDTVMSLVRMIKGDLAVDLTSPLNRKLLSGARKLGLLPVQEPVCMMDLLAQTSGHG